MKWKTKWDITTNQQQQSLDETWEQIRQKKLLYMKVYIGFIRFYSIFRWVQKENGHCLREMPKRKLVCHWILFVENRIGTRDSKSNGKNSIWSDWFWIHIKKTRRAEKVCDEPIRPHTFQWIWNFCDIQCPQSHQRKIFNQNSLIQTHDFSYTSSPPPLKTHSRRVHFIYLLEKISVFVVVAFIGIRQWYIFIGWFFFGQKMWIYVMHGIGWTHSSSQFSHIYFSMVAISWHHIDNISRDFIYTILKPFSYHS